MSNPVLVERDDDPVYGDFRLTADGQILLGPDRVLMGTADLDVDTLRIGSITWTEDADEVALRDLWMEWAVGGLAEARAGETR